MPTFSFELSWPGSPIPQGRPRFSRFGHAFDPKAREKRLARSVLKLQWTQSPTSEPLRVSIKFSMPIPKSTSKKKRAQLIGNPHVIKPDIDNLAKFALDVLNGIVYTDDACVFDLKVVKEYAEKPHTSIIISNVA